MVLLMNVDHDRSRRAGLALFSPPLGGLGGRESASGRSSAVRGARVSGRARPLLDRPAGGPGARSPRGGPPAVRTHPSPLRRSTPGLSLGAPQGTSACASADASPRSLPGPGIYGLPR